MANTQEGCSACPAGKHSKYMPNQKPHYVCVQCPPTYIQWQSKQTKCVQCPPRGIDCTQQNRIQVQKGYYVEPAAWNATSRKPQPVRCPFQAMCVGSNAPDAQCSNGSSGLLCGECSFGYYRTDGACIPCPEADASTVSTILLLMLGSGALPLALYAYLRSATRGASTAAKPSSSQLAERATRALARLPLRRVATIAKILISYCQMLVVFDQLQSVHWPADFVRFIRSLNIVLLAGVEALLAQLLLPISCKTGELSAYTWLMVILALPLVCSFLIFAIGALARTVARRRAAAADGEGRVGSLIPATYTLHIWVVLLMYPSLCREVFSTFMCQKVGGRFWLNADTREECYVPKQVPWIMLSVVGALVYALGAPLGTLALARQWHRAGADRRRTLIKRLELLLVSYTEECWWFEAADLLRKLLLTSIVLLVAPGTRVQIWFGLLVSMVATITTIAIKPYADPLCQRLQSIATLQIAFDYITATVFFVEPGLSSRQAMPVDSGVLPPLLVAVNCSAFALIFVALLRGTHSVLALKPAQLEDGSPALAGRPQREWHVFISHQWSSGQDQARALKSQLTALVPDVRCFLDVDDLTDIGSLEELVDATDTIIVFLAGAFDADGSARSDYMRSANCVRELRTAVAKARPMIFVLETDPQHGGVSMEVHRRDCPSELRHVLDGEQHPIVPWYRARAFLAVSMRLILSRVLGSAVRIPGESPPTAPLPSPAPPARFHLYASARNAGASEIVELLTAEAQRARHSSAGVLAVTTDAAEAAEATFFLLYLNGETHDDAPALHAELEAALHEGRQLLLVHEQRDAARGAVPFSSVIARTPRRLVELGVYRELATPLYDGEEHQAACLRAMLGRIASSADGAARRLPDGGGWLRLRAMRRAMTRLAPTRVRIYSGARPRQETPGALLQQQEGAELGGASKKARVSLQPLGSSRV